MKAKPHLNEAGVSKEISLMWHAESEEVKDRFSLKAEVLAVKHKADNPDYKFLPMSREMLEVQKAIRHAESKMKAATHRYVATQYISAIAGSESHAGVPKFRQRHLRSADAVSIVTNCMKRTNSLLRLRKLCSTWVSADIFAAGE